MKLFNAIATAAVVGASLVAATPVKACEYYMQMSRDFGYQADKLVEKAGVAAAKEDRKDKKPDLERLIVTFTAWKTVWEFNLINQEETPAKKEFRRAKRKARRRDEADKKKQLPSVLRGGFTESSEEEARRKALRKGDEKLRQLNEQTPGAEVSDEILK